MIKIDFEEPTSEPWQSWKQSCAAAQQEVLEALARGEIPEITDLYKLQSECYRSLAGAFHGKCAYCETLIQANQPGDLDHFRPKSSVKNFDFSVVQLTREGGSQVPHPGYRWLAYDWQNLLPACADCNRPTKQRTGGIPIGKGDRFPVRAFRAASPGEEIDEEPLLIHPAFEDPEPHLTIDETGILTPQTDRGNTCIEVFGLNIREALVESRKRMYEDTRNRMMILLQAAHSGADITEQFKDLQATKAGSQPHSIAARAAIIKERDILAPLLDV